MGLKRNEKQVVTREYRPRYQKASKKEKSAILAEFTRLTGYHRKSAVRLLSGKPVREVLIYADGGAVKLKPEQKRAVNRMANRKGKRMYTDEVIAALRLIWNFFWNKCGRKRSFRRYRPHLCGSRWRTSPDGLIFTSRRIERKSSKR